MMSDLQERDFKGIFIPKEIWLDDELSMLDKGIWAEINSLDNDSHCFASNEYLANFCSCSQSAVSKSIKKLTELGYIKVVSFNGRQRVLESSLVKFTRQTSKIYESDSENLRCRNIEKRNKEESNLSKDKLQNSKKESFSLGKQKKDKKPSLYDKCVSLIYERTKDEKLQKALLDYLAVRLEMKDKPLYTNSWKGLLNKLEREFRQDERLDVVYQSIERGYASFFPVSTGSLYNKEKVTYGQTLEGIPHDGRYDNEDHTRSGLIF